MPLLLPLPLPLPRLTSSASPFGLLLVCVREGRAAAVY